MLHQSIATKGIRQICREFGEARLFHTDMPIATTMKYGKQNTLNAPSLSVLDSVLSITAAQVSWVWFLSSAEKR